MLQAFLAVAESGSFSLAAQQLYLTQPAVSKRIAALEDDLAVKLFERLSKQVILTEAGKQLWPRARRITQEMADCRQVVSDLGGTVSGVLQLATSHHIGLHHLAAPLKRFVQQFPQVTLDVHFVDSEQAHEQVLAGELELAFLTLPPVGDDRLNYVTIWNDPLIFVTAPFHPLAQQTELSLENLIAYPSLLPASHTYTSQITLAEFEKKGLKPKITMSNNPLESIRMLVSIGLGWSVLPKTLLNQDLKQLDLNLDMQRQLGMVWHPARIQSKAAEELINMMQLG